MIFKLNDELRRYNLSNFCEQLKLDLQAKVEVDEVDPESGLDIYQVTLHVIKIL